jgi:hypothetical protein
MPTSNQQQTACPNVIQTSTRTDMVTFTAPETDVVITLTATAITVSTLFDYNYLIPATFQPNLGEPT